MIRIMFIVILLSLSTLSKSEVLKCTVNSALEITDDGYLKEAKANISMGRQGSSFLIDTETGIVSSNPVFENTNNVKNGPIISKQGKNNSLIILTQHISGDVTLVRVSTYKKSMPFYYTATILGTATGNCTSTL